MAKTLPAEVTMSALRENLSAYLDAAEAGATFTVTRRGRPSATLTAAGPGSEPIDLDELRAFRASLGVKVEENAVVAARQGERY